MTLRMQSRLIEAIRAAAAGEAADAVSMLYNACVLATPAEQRLICAIIAPASAMPERRHTVEMLRRMATGTIG